MSTSGSPTRTRSVARTEVRAGGMLKECGAPGCRTLTLGDRCIAHEVAVTRALPRGVPHLEPASLFEETWLPAGDAHFVRG